MADIIERFINNELVALSGDSYRSGLNFVLGQLMDPYITSRDHATELFRHLLQNKFCKLPDILILIITKALLHDTTCNTTNEDLISICITEQPQSRRYIWQLHYIVGYLQLLQTQTRLNIRDVLQSACSLLEYHVQGDLVYEQNRIKLADKHKSDIKYKCDIIAERLIAELRFIIIDSTSALSALARSFNISMDLHLSQSQAFDKVVKIIDKYRLLAEKLI